MVLGNRLNRVAKKVDIANSLHLPPILERNRHPVTCSHFCRSHPFIDRNPDKYGLRAIEAGDRATGVPVLQELYDRMKGVPGSRAAR